MASLSPPPAQQVGFDQQPRAVANRCDRLFGVGERAIRPIAAFVRAQAVRIADSARQQQSIIIRGRCIRDRMSGLIVLPGSS